MDQLGPDSRKNSPGGMGSIREAIVGNIFQQLNGDA